MAAARPFVWHNATGSLNRTTARAEGIALQGPASSNDHAPTNHLMKRDALCSSLQIKVADRIIHQMLSGVGASWHSILHPPVSHGGSAFGGTPPNTPEHEQFWASLERHAEWLGLKFIRAEMDWRQWQPERGLFTWDSAEMQILYRILSWAQRHGSDVMLQSMWINTRWMAFPEYRHDPALVQVSAPADLDAFADGWVILLRELIERRGYTCIRWINLVNEPNFYWWLLPPDIGKQQDRARQTRYLADALRKVRLAIQTANLPVKIMGPDFTDLPLIKNLSAEPWWAHVDDVDFHSYCSCFDWEDPEFMPATGAYRMGERLAQTLANYRTETRAAGRGLFLTEFGTQTYGCKADDPAPGSFKASLKDTELLVRCLNLGLDGFNHWSFANRGDQDGQWQFVDTWDTQWKHWLAEATPHRDAYYVLGLATRHLPQRAQILATEVQGGEAQGYQRVWAAAVRSPWDESLTVLIVNDAEQSWHARICGLGLSNNMMKLISAKGASPQDLRYERIAMNQGAADLSLPMFSLTILTDRPLAMDEPGRW
jgi:hypothetical protein